MHIFYKRELVIPPYKSYEEDKKPIEYINVEDALWNNKTNKKEAQRVVERLYQILQETKDEKSIGIITFNRPQRDLIEDLIDKKCIESAEFKELYQEKKKKIADLIKKYAREIEESGEEWKYEEGCLSIPNIREDVLRQPKIKIKFLDIEGN